LVYEAAGVTTADSVVTAALDPDYNGIACEEAIELTVRLYTGGLETRRWLRFRDKILTRRLGRWPEWCIMRRITWGEH
jgi:hypothetical protein